MNIGKKKRERIKKMVQEDIRVLIEKGKVRKAKKKEWRDKYEKNKKNGILTRPWDSVPSTHKVLKSKDIPSL